MRSEEIDSLIRRYAEERRHQPLQVAQAHFLAHVYLLCRGGEVEPFMKQTRWLLAYYIDTLSLFENPFRNTQACWLALMFLLFGYSLYLMTDDALRHVGIVVCTGTVVFGVSLWKIVWSSWLDTSLLIACYREIIDLIDRQLPLAEAEAAA